MVFVMIAVVKMGCVDTKSNSVPNWTDSSIAILAVWHLSAPLATHTTYKQVGNFNGSN